MRNNYLNQEMGINNSHDNCNTLSVEQHTWHDPVSCEERHHFGCSDTLGEDRTPDGILEGFVLLVVILHVLKESMLRRDFPKASNWWLLLMVVIIVSLVA